MNLFSSRSAWGGLAFFVIIGVIAIAIITGSRQSQADSPSETPTTAPVRADLPDWGPAPEITDEVWINSPPLHLADLRGQVVLINFWTFECYNCKNVLPYVRQWHDTYSDKGLVVIGVHYPEFSYEADLDNLKNAVKDLGVTWAVAQDNDGRTWNAYQQRYWPTVYLIDKRGNFRYTRIGEGAYSETEAAIKALLAETYAAPTATPTPAGDQ